MDPEAVASAAEELPKKIDIYRQLIGSMAGNKFKQVTYDGLSHCFMMSDEYLELTLWCCDALDKAKLMIWPNFQFYRDYIIKFQEEKQNWQPEPDEQVQI